ncbi:tRNA (adenosine(37)-N6)-threonylcarbamoyltransferase complex ATPase subunit type 1 TsaE [Chryseobacterium sp. MFBS3-17]|nr:tRNA (adenosine(37)-N6)-threonylcarbamoyltransferase complex ATPase subunit type 1 TsaE [Chryseobacterium sp. MFBS3-17]MCC2591434.1 tRNA (adenosine(37)-N6)-threonylcarbamoyltransferase complex ATPase subunit type 1 TsaE [Chryseobacterium sp. MFBS3-17]
MMHVVTMTDWEKVTEEILPQLEHNILLLKGNLGAGKTTFTQFLIRKLGSTDEATSPTYTIVNQYNSPAGDIFHFDLYRLKNTGEVLDIGIDEYLDRAALCIIEWPEVYETELEGISHHEMRIENTGEGRTVFFK